MIKFKKKIQFYFKKIFQIFFLLIYGKVKYQKDNTYSNNIIKRKIENIVSDIKGSKSYFSYKIKNGRVYTDYVEHVAIIDDNTLINGASYQQVLGELRDANENIVLNKGTPRIKKRIEGRVLSLVQGASGNKNYLHWVFDILPKIKLCSEHYPLSEIDYFYAPSLQYFQKETLSILNIDKNKILDSNVNRHIENDKEVFDFLKQKGFSKYRTGELSFFEQIYLFNNAKFIIGAHGAAFTNLTFCKPNTNIIEIKPLAHPNNVNKRISQINKLNYRLIKTKNLDENKKKFGDIYLPIKELEHCLKSFD